MTGPVRAEPFLADPVLADPVLGWSARALLLLVAILAVVALAYGVTVLVDSTVGIHVDPPAAR